MNTAGTEFHCIDGVAADALRLNRFSVTYDFAGPNVQQAPNDCAGQKSD
jgi:hypothetical protein